VLLDGRPIERPGPDRGVVFQEYALFPWQTVQQNVEYGLRVRGVPRAQRRQRALAALDTVRLDGFSDRRPTALSGGQRQRVALARALVIRPAVLLLDEPLGALDLKLREEMQVELKAIQREVGITFVFVTHDQQEALTMSDRIAVFNHGRIEQVGAPGEIYEHPATAFVAGFVGTANLLTGDAARTVLGQDGMFSVRPEKIVVADASPGRAGDVSADEVTVDGTLADVVYVGPETRFLVDTDAGIRMVALEQNAGTGPGLTSRAPGQWVRLSWRREHVARIPAGEPADAAVDAAVDPVLTDR
jgi:putative spermidine/putrescine transport system ATP-binding protein